MMVTSMFSIFLEFSSIIFRSSCSLSNACVSAARDIGGWDSTPHPQPRLSDLYEQRWLGCHSRRDLSSQLWAAECYWQCPLCAVSGWFRANWCRESLSRYVTQLRCQQVRTGHCSAVELQIFVCRWFDKSFQLVVTRGGYAALNFEHSWGDGVAVLRFFEEIYNDRKHQYSADKSSLEGVVRLDFNLSDKVKNTIDQAREEIEERCRTLSVKTLQYHKYGKNFIKKLKLSPDALLQLAIQACVWSERAVAFSILLFIHP